MAHTPGSPLFGSPATPAIMPDDAAAAAQRRHTSVHAAAATRTATDGTIGRRGRRYGRCRRWRYHSRTGPAARATGAAAAATDKKTVVPILVLLRGLLLLLLLLAVLRL